MSSDTALHLQLRNVVDELSQRLRRPPLGPEVAKRLGVSEDEVLDAMEVGAVYRSSSLDAQTQIASEIGISQMHVSRLLSRTSTNLRRRLQAAGV